MWTLHAADTGFFDIPVDHLMQRPSLSVDYHEYPLPTSVVAPDHGGEQNELVLFQRPRCELGSLRQTG